MPVPVSVSAVVEGWASLVNVSVALVDPVVEGLKVTVNGTLWPVEIVTGSESPPTLNAELVVLAAVTVTLAPLAVRLPDAVPLLPTTTLPTPRVVGLTASCPEAVVVPVPESAKLIGLFDALLATEAVAVKVPAAFGANLTLIVVLCPTATVTGRLGAVKEKYGLEIETLVTVTEVGPELVAVADRVLLLPAATLPKSRVADCRERVACCWLEGPALTPWQPTRTMRLARRNNAPAAFPRCFEQIPSGFVLCIVSHGTVPTDSMTAWTGDGSSPSVCYRWRHEGRYPKCKRESLEGLA